MESVFWLAASLCCYAWLAGFRRLFGQNQFVVAGNSQAVLFSGMHDQYFVHCSE